MKESKMSIPLLCFLNKERQTIYYVVGKDLVDRLRNMFSCLPVNFNIGQTGTKVIVPYAHNHVAGEIKLFNILVN